MSATSFTLFETAIGTCAIAWHQAGIVGVQLPEAREQATRARMVRRFPGAAESKPPREVRHALDRIVELLAGRPSDLSSIELDMEGVPAFHRRVYEVARTIAPGATLSYGEVARRAGSPGSARAVGQALGRNPFAIVVPCHRVLAAGGKVGGFSADGGITTKLRMLAIERAHSAAEPSSYAFSPATAVRRLRRTDDGLARVIDAVGPFRLELKHTTTLFGALAEAIVYQQLTGKAAATIFGRVCALFPRAQDGPTAKQLLGASEAKLRRAGLSRAKTASLRDLARKAADGEIPTLAQARRMSDEDLVESLTAVRGIGRWTVEMLLIFRLGRGDVLPVGDYGIRKGFAVAFRKRALPSPADVTKRGERWRPYRTVASWYLWRAVELAKR